MKFRKSSLTQHIPDKQGVQASQNYPSIPLHKEPEEVLVCHDWLLLSAIQRHCWNPATRWRCWQQVQRFVRSSLSQLRPDSPEMTTPKRHIQPRVPSVQLISTLRCWQDWSSTVDLEPSPWDPGCHIQKTAVGSPCTPQSGNRQSSQWIAHLL